VTWFEDKVSHNLTNETMLATRPSNLERLSPQSSNLWIYLFFLTLLLYENFIAIIEIVWKFGKFFT